MFVVDNVLLMHMCMHTQATYQDLQGTGDHASVPSEGAYDFLPGGADEGAYDLLPSSASDAAEGASDHVLVPTEGAYDILPGSAEDPGLGWCSVLRAHACVRVFHPAHHRRSTLPVKRNGDNRLMHGVVWRPLYTGGGGATAARVVSCATASLPSHQQPDHVDPASASIEAAYDFLPGSAANTYDLSNGRCTPEPPHPSPPTSSSLSIFPFLSVLLTRFADGHVHVNFHVLARSG